jgi:hypothetical protein
MSNVDNLSIGDIKWLLNEYNRIRNYGQVNKYIDMHVKSMTMLKGSAQKPDCSCAYAATARIASSIYEQHEPELKNKLVILESPVIDELPEVKRRGRKRSETNTGEE